MFTYRQARNICGIEQFWEAQILENYRNQAKATNNYIILDKQLRMQASSETMDWIDAFTKRQELKKLPQTSDGYTIKVFDDPGCKWNVYLRMR